MQNPTPQPTDPRDPHRLWRWAKYVILLVALSIVGEYGLKTLHHLHEKIANVRGISFEASDSQLFALEYHRFRGSLGRYVAGAPSTDLDTVMLQFDILWARCETMSHGPLFAVMRDDLQIDWIAGDLLAVLQEIEPMVLALQPGDTDVLSGLLDSLDSFDRRFTEHVVDLSLRRSRWGTEYRDQLAGIVWELDELVLAIVGLTVVFSSMFGLETIRARTAEKQVRLREERVRFLAYHDPLTRCANRTSFAEKLAATLEEARAASGQPALLMLDLDGFKLINDTFGHSSGDELLITVARRLGDMVAGLGDLYRLGGDEFALLIKKTLSVDELSMLAEKVIELVEKPITVEHRDLHISVSIGISRYPEDGTKSAELMRNSDVALYAAKAAGKRTYRNYLPDMGARMVRRKEIERALRGAIAEGRLEVHYQPQISLEHGGVVAVEALCRWNDPELGVVRPDEFVSVAEESGLILDLGHWVLRTVAATVSRWPKSLEHLKVAVNLSPAQFAHRDLVSELRLLVVETGIDLSRLELEITETALMRDTEATIEQLRALRALGVGLSIDDFGKGYSSLGYLRRFPITQLKIDRSFISEIEREKCTLSVVRGIIRLAASLGVEVVAEGVENAAQAELLRRECCAMAQGWLYAPALASSGLEAWIVERTKRERGPRALSVQMLPPERSESAAKQSAGAISRSHPMGKCPEALSVQMLPPEGSESAGEQRAGAISRSHPIGKCPRRRASDRGVPSSQGVDDRLTMPGG